MEKKGLFITVGIVLVIFLLIVSFLGIGKDEKQDVPLDAARISEGQVTIKITPIEFKDGIFSFNIQIDTHTGSLEDYNLAELTELIYSDKSIKPVSAPTLSGHHSSGILQFQVEEKPEQFRIVVNGIPDIERREFVWE